MALIMDTILDGDVIAPAAYIIVNTVSVNRDDRMMPPMVNPVTGEEEVSPKWNVSMNISVHKDSETQVAITTHRFGNHFNVKTEDITEVAANPVAWAYTHLKTLDAFATATDG